MSRIYDALQRADRERQATQETAVPKSAEPYAAPGAGELPPAEAGISLGEIALHPWKPSLTALPTLGERGECIEQFRSLRSQIYQFRDQGPLKTILVSSGMPSEGKSFVTANLAISLARNKNNNILLIDADLRSPSLHSLLGAPRKPGLTEYLAGNATAEEILQSNQDPRIIESGRVLGIPNFTFIPAGAGGDNSSELIANHRSQELIATLAPYFDWILIDTPPALAFADAVDLARAADAVLLVARGASTTYDVAQRAQATFSNSRVLGFVLNAVKNAPHTTSYYYYYGKGESDGRAHG